MRTPHTECGSCIPQDCQQRAQKQNGAARTAPSIKHPVYNTYTDAAERFIVPIAPL